MTSMLSAGAFPARDDLGKPVRHVVGKPFGRLVTHASSAKLVCTAIIAVARPRFQSHRAIGLRSQRAVGVESSYPNKSSCCTSSGFHSNAISDPLARADSSAIAAGTQRRRGAALLAAPATCPARCIRFGAPTITSPVHEDNRSLVRRILVWLRRHRVCNALLTEGASV